MKNYTTNKFKSVLFYISILWPLLVIFITIVCILNYSKGDWFVLAFLYIFAVPIEYLFVKFRIMEIAIDENGITVKNAHLLYKAKWEEVVELNELLFGHGQLLYELKTKNKKNIGFNDSIENCSDLLKEIELHTGLKFKQRL